MNGIDRLIERIGAAGAPVVVGLDPALSMMPCALAREMYADHGETARAVAEMFLLYNKAIIGAVSDIVPAVKPQIAMYERYGLDGLVCYARTCEYAASKGLYVIGDIKRGDIGSTADAYAAHLAGADVAPDGARADTWSEDAVTVNPYFGTDGVAPFVRAARESGKAIFMLVKTSNPTSAELQDLRILDDAAPLYEHVGALVERWGADSLGAHGYSAVGAVVGATHPEVGRRLRRLMPHTFFLVPGYGAQGATAADLGGFFDSEGGGAVVSSSRGIIAAWRKAGGDDAADARTALEMVAAAAREAAQEMRADLAR